MRLKSYVSIFFFAACVFGVLAPQTARAADALPLCATSSASQFTSYVYPDGKLHSFDYYVPGTTTPVVLSTTVGTHALEARYVSLWAQAGKTKVHVDVPGWYPLQGSVPVEIMLARPGCVEQVRASVSLPARPQYVYQPNTSTTVISPVATARPTNTAKPSVSKPSDTSEVITAQCSPTSVLVSWKPVAGAQKGYQVERKGESGSFTVVNIIPPGYERMYLDTAITPGKEHTYRIVALDATESPIPALALGPTSCTVPADAAGGAIAPSFTWGKAGGALCSSLPLPAWISLIIAHIVASFLIIDARKYLLQGNGWRFTVALFVPFMGLLGIWFFMDQCRTSQWFPILTTLVTLVTLFVPTFWKEKGAVRQLVVTEKE